MEKVKKFYNKYCYPKAKLKSKTQIKNNEKMIKRILGYGNIKVKELKNKRILDCGCGTGEKTLFLSKNKAKVMAIDFSENQLKYCKEKIKKDVILLKKDIIKNNLNDLGKFDIIICLGVLHHTENAYLGFCKICKLLKKDGIIILGLYHKYSRLRYRLERWLIRLFISKNENDIVEWLKSKKYRFMKKRALEVLYDRYAVPYESYHTLREVKKWFKKNNIEYLKSSENVKGIEMFKIFNRKTIFFVSGKKVTL